MQLNDNNSFQNGVSPMAWSPLGGGKLFSSSEVKYVKLRSTLQRIGRELVTDGSNPPLQIDQVAYIWLLQHPSKINIVLGTNKSDRIRAAAECLKYSMSLEQWFEILEASTGEPCP